MNEAEVRGDWLTPAEAARSLKIKLFPMPLRCRDAWRTMSSSYSGSSDRQDARSSRGARSTSAGYRGERFVTVSKTPSNQNFVNRVRADFRRLGIELGNEQGKKERTT